MYKEDYNQLVTKGDLQTSNQILIKAIKEILDSKNSHKEFLTSKEFAHSTGQKYSTIIYKCKCGLLKARQDAPGCTWFIHASEIDRFRNEATEIYTGDLKSHKKEKK